MEQNKIIKTLKEGVLKNKAYTLKPIETPIKLNQNESPFDIPEEIKEAILGRLKEKKWNVYPDFVPDAIYRKVSAYFGLTESQILIGNGSNEMIFTILAATLEKGKKVILPHPTFTVYQLISSNINAQIKLVNLKPDFSFDTDAIIREAEEPGSVTVICTPNNPTGTHMNRTDLIRLIEKSGGIVVADEAYIQFGGESVIDLINQYPNLIVLRTFSKAFGLAGLRIGMMASNPDLIRELSKVKLPYNLNIFTLITLEELFNHTSLIEKNVRDIMTEKEFLLNELIKLKSIQITPSSANFFLFETSDPKKVFNGLVNDGILIRDYSSYPMLEKHLRVSVGTREENIRFLESLKKHLP